MMFGNCIEIQRVSCIFCSIFHAYTQSRISYSRISRVETNFQRCVEFKKAIFSAHCETRFGHEKCFLANKIFVILVGGFTYRSKNRTIDVVSRWKVCGWRKDSPILSFLVELERDRNMQRALFCSSAACKMFIFHVGSFGKGC